PRPELVEPESVRDGEERAEAQRRRVGIELPGMKREEDRSSRLVLGRDSFDQQAHRPEAQAEAESERKAPWPESSRELRQLGDRSARAAEIGRPRGELRRSERRNGNEARVVDKPPRDQRVGPARLPPRGARERAERCPV